MKIIDKIYEMKRESNTLIQNNKTIGFVPTMGALHEGHFSLVEASISNNDVSVVSIFVNPLQFDDKKDLDKYPVRIYDDSKKLDDLGVDIVFCPPRDEMYKIPSITKFDMSIFNILCGKKRQGHFSGVCVVLSRLMNMISPTNMYMGMKDYQQLCIVERLILDLGFSVNLVGMPIIRDIDGLALSSRNEYLTIEDRDNALSINKSRDIVKDYVGNGSSSDVSELIELISNNLSYNGLRVDYVEIRESGSLNVTERINNSSRIFIAAYSGIARLIDNFSVEECM